MTVKKETVKEVLLVTKVFLNDECQKTEDVTEKTGIPKKSVEKYLNDKETITKYLDLYTYLLVTLKLKHKMIKAAEALNTYKMLSDPEFNKRINGEPWRRFKRQSVNITMPEMKVILSEDFDYGNYANQIFYDTLEYRKGNAQGYFEGIDDIDFDSIKKTPKVEITDPIEKEYQEKIYAEEMAYYHQFFVLQHQFEALFAAGASDLVNDDITKAMVELTKNHLANIEKINVDYFDNYSIGQMTSKTSSSKKR